MGFPGILGPQAGPLRNLWQVLAFSAPHGCVLPVTKSKKTDPGPFQSAPRLIHSPRTRRALPRVAFQGRLWDAKASHATSAGSSTVPEIPEKACKGLTRGGAAR